MSKLRVIDLKGIFSEFTNVKIVINGNTDVYMGYFYQVPEEYWYCDVECIIPIKHPNHDKLGMAAILLEGMFE